MLIYQVSIRLIFRNIRLMRCFGSSYYFQSTKEAKVSDLHSFVAVYNSHAIELHKPHHVLKRPGARSSPTKLTEMQVNDILEPNVRIRELKKDRVNFVLENVDIS
jgi:hypothetical protein